MAPISNSATIIRWDTGQNLGVELRKHLTGWAAYLSEDGERITGQKRQVTKGMFDQCVWKGSAETLESRIFRTKDVNKKDATLLTVDTATKKIYVLGIKNFNDENLKTKKPTVQINQGVPTFAWEELPQDQHRNQAFDETAEDDLLREKDCATMCLNVVEKALSTRMSKVVVAAVGTKAALAATSAVWNAGYATVSGVYSVGSFVVGGAYSVGSFILNTTVDYVVIPAADTLGYPAFVVATAVAAVEIADACMPERRIIPRIQETFNQVMQGAMGERVQA